MSKDSILIIDDDIEMAAVLADYVDVLGLFAIVETNPRSALEQMKSLNPAAVLLDIRMPELDGLELVQHIAKLNDPPPIIVVSGAKSTYLDAAGALADCAGLEVIGTLRKPVGFADFKAMFQSHPALSKALSST